MSVPVSWQTTTLTKLLLTTAPTMLYQLSNGPRSLCQTKKKRLRTAFESKVTAMDRLPVYFPLLTFFCNLKKIKKNYKSLILFEFIRAYVAQFRGGKVARFSNDNIKNMVCKLYAYLSDISNFLINWRPE